MLTLPIPSPRPPFLHPSPHPLFPLPRRALVLGVLRDPGSEVEDRQYQVDLQAINIGTAQWEQLKPEKDASKGGVPAEGERNSQNPALEWNMASRWGEATLSVCLSSLSASLSPCLSLSLPLSLPLFLQIGRAHV